MKGSKMSNKVFESIAVVVTIGIILAAVYFFKTKYNQKDNAPVALLNKVTSDSVMTVKIYAYCPCTICNRQWAGMVSTGQTMAELKEKGLNICAADPTVLPYGTTIKYDGKEYYVTDCGSAIKGDTINILMEHHKDTLEFGIKESQIIELLSKK